MQRYLQNFVCQVGRGTETKLEARTVGLTVMQIFRFSANFADFVAVIFVNRLNPLRQFRRVWEGVSGAQCIFSRVGN